MTIKEIKKLSDDELRIEVAERCGWHRALFADNRWHRCLVTANSPEELPDYVHDLNAIAAACQAEYDRDPYFASEYCVELGRICCGQLSTAEDWSDHSEDLILATARQRAEAFALLAGKRTTRT